MTLSQAVVSRRSRASSKGYSFMHDLLIFYKFNVFSPPLYKKARSLSTLLKIFLSFAQSRRFPFVQAYKLLEFFLTKRDFYDILLN
jgi:hypothetical protein